MRILKFTAEWCGPCKALKKTQAVENAAKVAGIPYIEIDVDQEVNKEMARVHGIRSIPAVLMINEKTGHIYTSLFGARTQEEYEKAFIMAKVD